MAKNLKEKLKIHDPQLYMTLSHISKHGVSMKTSPNTKHTPLIRQTAPPIQIEDATTGLDMNTTYN